MQPTPRQIGVFGASGYAGMELCRLLASHPRVQLAFATSDRWAGSTLGERLGLRGPLATLPYLPFDEAIPLAADCDLVFLATPAEASARLAPRLLEKGCAVIDLSGAFRFTDAERFASAYGFPHPAPELLGEAVYGLSELSREKLQGARLVANPGCYPTAASLPLAPLLATDLLDVDAPVVIWAASGVTGAGRRANEDFSFSEIDGDFRAYRVFRHQHQPEIAGTLGGLTGRSVSITFTPHLLPLRRGILCTTHAQLGAGVDADRVAAALEEAYGDETFVQLAPSAEAVALKHVVGTNDCRIGFAVHGRELLLISAIDNLVKGAAGQAVQNLNLVMGWEEHLGVLPVTRGMHP